MALKNIVDTLKNVFTKDKEEAESLENLQARVLVSTLFYNNSVFIIDENGESHTPPIPDPTEEEFLVKKGDRINEFEVVEVTTNFVVLKSFAEHTTDNSSTPTTQFIIEKGECIHLNMCGVYDAVHKTSISYIETEGEMDMDTRRELPPVTKDLWDISPMPEKNTQFKIKREFSAKEIQNLKLGHLPEEMEDRWFAYYEDDRYYIHRSWSGNCIYIVEFNFKTNKHTVTVNRDDNQYANTDLEEDIEQVNELLTWFS